ncbi:MAG: TetR/AcrR family transcriptional regulator [Bacteroidetes bacterium]|nr:TetR/AcrR family transcriptional regulator [Bacteroidota bacterium]
MPRSKEQFKEMREKTRSIILEKALLLFANKGFHGTSINDIANEAGISKGLAYNYFESKDAILQAIIDTALTAGLEVMNVSKLSDDPYKQLELLIVKTFDHIQKNDNYWRMFSTLMLQPKLSNITEKMVNEFGTNAMNETIKIFKKIGIRNPETEALILDGVLDGIILHYLFFKDKYPIKKVKNKLLKKYSREELEKIKVL